MKRHHKVIAGSFGTIVIIFMIFTGILLNTILIKIDRNHEEINKKIKELDLETQGKINTLAENILETQDALLNINQSLGEIFVDFKTEFAELKASAGEDFSGIIEEVVESVVTIKTDISQGTGFMINSEGYIVTNYHVIKGAKRAAIITYDRVSHQTKLIGVDTNLDIALLKIEGDYKELEFGDSNKIQPGEKVIAIGNPLGLQFSVSQGIVSAVHRMGENRLEAYIQTDTALNPGNSGGPLINKQGRAIGINNFKIGGGESLGFALESNYIIDSVNQIALKSINQTIV